MNHKKTKGSTKVFSIVVVALMVFIALTLISCSSPEEAELSNNTNSNSSLNENIEEEKECLSDEDCVHLPVCCHRNAMQCVPKYKVNENTLTKCKDVFCTTECRDCTTCRCVDNKCVTETIEGSCC